jgi:ABC-type multidrug transport system fused ATPase/permease subunit
VVPALPQAQPVASLSVLLCVVFSGQTIRGDAIPFYWRPLYYANPLAWALRSLAINEFSSPAYAQLTPYPPVPPVKLRPWIPLGDVILLNLGFKTGRAWVWYGVFYLLALWALLLLLTMAAMHFVRWSGRSNVPMTEPNPAEQNGGGKSDDDDGATDAGSEPGTPSPRSISSGQPQGGYSLLSEPLVFRPITLSFQELFYTVEVQKERVQLLKGVSGYAKPGTMTALMGSSGAGG